MKGSKPPKVFISYAWSSVEHQEWVVRLATRLMECEVDVVLDLWDLKEGQDKYAFMEKSASSDEIDKILVICDQTYKEKADSRLGGVGTETQILSPSVYDNVDQQKVIPIIAEVDDKGNTFIPIFIKNRIYINLSSEHHFEEQFEKLLRNLHNQPLHRKPKLGVAPSWLFEEAPNHFRTANINQQIQDAIQRNPQRVKGLSEEFYSEFIESLESFRYEASEGKELDDVVVEHIHNMLPLRDDYIRFLELQSSSKEIVDFEPFISFFERIYPFTDVPKGFSGTFIREQFDHYKFLIRELFIFTFIVLLEKAQYRTLSDLLGASYFLDRDGILKPNTYDSFDISCRSIDEVRNNRLKLQKISLSTDILINQRTTGTYDKVKIVQADLILYYRSVLTTSGKRWTWYPRSYIYGEYFKLPFIQRLQSKRFANQVIGLFECTTIEEMKQKFSEFTHKHSGSQSMFHEIDSISEQIPIDRIGSVN